MTVTVEQALRGPVRQGARDSRQAPVRRQALVPHRVPVRHQVPVRRRAALTRPAGCRPAVTPLPYRGHRIAVSRTPHARRRVSTAATAGLAAMAALITLWLGCVAQFSSSHAVAPSLPDRLAVVQVQPGETLHHLAARIAPGSSPAAVAEQIKDLNQLRTGDLDAGQTLIAPVS